MNAQSVWVGSEYAYTPYVRRGSFPMDCIEVKVLKKEQILQYGKKREDTIVTVSSPRWNFERKVNVRNLYDFWDSYEDEKEHRLKERERRNAAYVAEQAAKQAERAKRQADSKLIAERLADKLGVSYETIQASEFTITIRTKDLEFLLERTHA